MVRKLLNFIFDLIRVLRYDQRRHATYSFGSHGVLIALDNGICFGVKGRSILIKGQSIDIGCEGRRVASMPVHEAFNWRSKLRPKMEASVDCVQYWERSWTRNLVGLSMALIG